MPLHYLDTSALAKRYVPEKGSVWVKNLCSTEPIAVSLLTVVEMPSGLARRTRSGDLTTQQRDTIFRQFIADTQQYTVLGVNEEMAQRAVELVLQSPVPLRALDALHLASAEECFRRAKQEEIATGSFVVADQRLIQAAQWAGLSTENPEGYA